jgi:hypothetical protein
MVAVPLADFKIPLLPFHLTLRAAGNRTQKFYSFLGVGHRSSIRRRISSAHLIASAMALTVTGSLLRNDRIIQTAAFIFIWALRLF